MAGELSISDFNYELPEERIAQHAAEPRDSSKLLLFSNGEISDHVFGEVVELLPENSTLFFNDAKVIPARILVKNSNGANIEIFLLQPFNAEYSSAVNALNYSEWSCLIGNLKKWKDGEVLEAMIAGVRLEMKLKAPGLVSFSWNGEQPFIELLSHLGSMPLPPYIKHKADKHDEARYQTVYSKTEGSVAAPTAGLHFTEKVLEDLDKRHIERQHVTLHVSAGTFLPVKTENALEHVMHKEVFSVRISVLKSLSGADRVIAVGTTSCRVLESLYWCGVNVINGHKDPFMVSQFPYLEDHSKIIPGNEAIDALVKYMESRNIDEIHGATSIMITPGYRFMMIKGLLTNFHQPKSTLLLLISAFIGENWKKVYKHALEGEYRFLSYGDSSLLLP